MSINKMPLNEKLKIFKEYQSGKYTVKEILDKYYLYSRDLYKIVNEFKNRRKPYGS